MLFNIRNQWDRLIEHQAEGVVYAQLRGVMRAALDAYHMTDPRADGLGAWRHLLPPGAVLTGPAPHDGMGQFWLVVSGEVLGPEGLLPPFSLVFVNPQDLALHVTAGAHGAELLILQYPRRKPDA